MATRTNELYDRTVFDNALQLIKQLGLERFAELYVAARAADAESLAKLLNKKLMDSRPSGG